LTYKITQLNQCNENADRVLDNLKDEERRLAKDNEDLKGEIDLMRRRLKETEDSSFNHRLHQVERENDIIGKKHLELSEGNAKLESQALALELELKDFIRQHDALKSKLQASNAAQEAQQSEVKKLKDQIDNEMRNLATSEEDVKNRLKKAEEDYRAKKEDNNRKRVELEKAKEDKIELVRVLDRLKESGADLNKKKEELLSMLAEQKRLAETAGTIRAQEEGKNRTYDIQQAELVSQYEQRANYLQDEAKRKTELLKRGKEREIADKQRNLEELRSRLSDLEVQEKQHLDQVAVIRQEKVRYQQLADTKGDKQKEIEGLEQKLDALTRAVKEKEDALALLSDPRIDLGRVNAELVKLEGKRIDLESTKSQLESELKKLERENKQAEDQVNLKKTEIMQTTQRKQEGLRDAQNQVEFQIMQCKKEQTELKGQIAELLKTSEAVTLY
jgi:chromosome segregation ATPase